MSPAELADALLERTLPYAEWTHQGHLTAGYALVGRLGGRAALATLRRAIPAYNESVGTPNTDHSGYHDTITAYYVWAIDGVVAAGADLPAVLAHPLTDVRAALRFWRPDTLFSVEARRAWVDPDLVASAAVVRPVDLEADWRQPPSRSEATRTTRGPVR
jgi:hypothetical protein